ncbi:hypothetical protein BDR07DRAFT_1480796 [Suillus spraguei]|nr:hypothetical protein BDR07DRAFT_1480796 [Suillus spraguei]
MARHNHDTSGDEEMFTVDELRAMMSKRPVQAKTDLAQNTQRWTRRSQSEAREVNKLVASFKKDGMLIMQGATGIPIMLSCARLRTGSSFVVNFDIPDAVPQLQLKDVNDIVVASGQHRVAALKKYFETVTAEIMRVKKRCDDMTELKNLEPDHLAEFDRLRDRLNELQETIIVMGKWGVIVYDEDNVLADGDVLAHHLCRNKSLHEYKETAEEVLSRLLRLAKIYDDASEHDRVDTALCELWTQRDDIERRKNAWLTKVLCVLRLANFGARTASPAAGITLSPSQGVPHHVARQLS